ncbi:hypothetical protein G4O51_03615 [Candidatus Bathyarchaeota archaeon A05DMB-2]|nr:hypothetical protein [Candidatus Bathyarchaeota archaeon A05DMB-2]
MVWEETEQYIRSGHRNPEDFEQDSLRTISISDEEGIKAVVGKLKGEDTTTVQSYLFSKEKGWTLDKAKAWFEQHREGLVKEHVSAILPFQVLEKIVDKPLRIRGVAMTSGVSRNFNIYTPEELQAFASKLVNSPVYIEHVSADSAVGKVTKTDWDGHALWYEAEIYESEVADKIRKGLVQHVSVGADYETLDILDGKVPHGLHNAELSLVAVPGIPETNIQIMEKLQTKEQLKEPENPKEEHEEVSLAESLLKEPSPSEPIIPIKEAVSLIQSVLPSPIVERSWSFGPQRLCQELRGVVRRLESRSQKVTVGSKQDELSETKTKNGVK